jgi:hypothetical protein
MDSGYLEHLLGTKDQSNQERTVCAMVVDPKRENGRQIETSWSRPPGRQTRTEEGIIMHATIRFEPKLRLIRYGR